MIIRKLNDSVAVLSGVGPKRLAALQTLKIKTIWDLLTYYPFRYDDFKVHDLSTAPDGAKITVNGRILNSPVISRFGYRKTRLNFKMMVNQQVINVSFFNQPWLKKRLVMGQPIVIYGRFNRAQASMNGIKLMQAGEQNQMAPIYPSSQGIRQKTIHELISKAYDAYHDVLYDYVPSFLRQKYRLEHVIQMIHDMHFPKDARAAYLARRTAKYNEFFLFQVNLQLLRLKKHRNASHPLKIDQTAVQQFIEKLPFRLTSAQRRVSTEILQDLSLPHQMNRLLQGDVGSGKTIVAAIAIYATVMAGYQTALLAPTEILAEQHANKLADLFADTPVRVGLLTSDTPPAVRREILTRIANGELNLIIGTHALIQPDIHYHKLGLGIIDEQHRFGVNQRKALREKGAQTNMLSMTATPIPRTVAITSYGEMDISVIDQLPQGRKPVKTIWIRSKQILDVLQTCQRHILAGEQMYVIAPLIEESSQMDMQNATDTYEWFKKQFPQFKIGLLHGKMPDDAKNQVMDDFKGQRIQVLVSTTVIEVGVDVANATMMLILNADHFGLAQLHQLRGRVGRSDLQSECILVADPKGELGRKRMNVLVDSNDGFAISQKDLELRGPGDVMGRQQSGIPNFKVGDPVADLTMLNIAQQNAIQIVTQPDWEKQTDNLGLVQRLQLQHSDLFD